MPSVVADDTKDDFSADELLLRAQGHHGELPRQFSSFAGLSLAFVVTNSWLGYCAVFAVPLLAGGGPAVFWGILVAALACFIITLGMAELASAVPSSGGQYHFAFMVSSENTRAVAAFTTGWLSVLAWCLTTTSALSFCAQMVLSLASLYHEDYEPTQWQVYLVYLLLTIAALLFVCLLPTALPRTEKMFFWCSLLAVTASVITLLAMSPTKQSGKTVFATYANVTGWSDGVSFLLAAGSSMYAFLGTDAVTHIAEEIPDSGKHVPRIMCATIVIGLATSVPFVLALLFAIQDYLSVAEAAMPVLELFSQATDRNQTATALFAFWVLLNFAGVAVACVATSGRLVWAFAHDHGLPFSMVLARVHPSLQVPVYATTACGVFTALYGLIYIGSTTAFNSIVAMAILALNVSYAAPQAILLFRGRDKIRLPPQRSLRLGRVLGPLVNAFSCLWVALYTVLFCFPTTLPVAVKSMNYVSMVVVGIVVLIVCVWFAGKRKSFTGPAIILESMCITPENMHNEQVEKV